MARRNRMPVGFSRQLLDMQQARKSGEPMALRFDFLKSCADADATRNPDTAPHYVMEADGVFCSGNGPVDGDTLLYSTDPAEQAIIQGA